MQVQDIVYSARTHMRSLWDNTPPATLATAQFVPDDTGQQLGRRTGSLIAVRTAQYPIEPLLLV